MLVLITLISLCYSLQITAAATDDKDMFAEPKVHAASLTQFLKSDRGDRALDLTFVHTFANALTHASTQRPIVEMLIECKQTAQIMDGRYMQNKEIAEGSLATLKVTNRPLAEHIKDLVKERPESSQFLVVWATHQLHKLGSELFDDKE